MKTTTTKLLFALVCLAIACGLQAQTQYFDSSTFTKHYVAIKETALTTAAETVTVAQPAASSGQNIVFDYALVYCSAACVATVARGGTAATTTALTPTPMSAGLAPAKAKAFHTSNAGAGTELAKYRVAAGANQVIPLRGIRLRVGGGTTEQLTIGTDVITSGTARIEIKWAEAQP
jgi:hypothetical protein